MDNNLQAAAEKYQKKVQEHLFDDSSIGTAKDAFIEGAKWHEEQMLKGAVEGTVHHVGTVHYIETNQDQLNKRLKQFEEGENVKIIIVKEG